MALPIQPEENKTMLTIRRPSSSDWGRAKAAILLLLVLQTLMLSSPTPGETAGWQATGSLITGRTDHTATLLDNGQVLVAGGYGAAGYLASAELYDPVTKTWSATNGPLATARSGHTATLLSNGQVLVAGGKNAGGWLGSAELYDPVEKTWSTTGAFTPARVWHTATLLGTGKVLVAGGSNSLGLTSTVLYNPGTATWSNTTGPLAIASSYHTATLLGTGKVLVAGGTNIVNSRSVYFTRSELYDPVPSTWSGTGALATGRCWHTATLLGAGQVLVAGGFNGSRLASAELYDPVAKTWSATTGPSPLPVSCTRPPC